MTGTVNGLRLRLVPPQMPDRLTVQIVLRGFGTEPIETTFETRVEVTAGISELSVPFTPPARIEGQFTYCTVEPWLIWHGEQPLRLVTAPEPY
jgi:hypothetical protein